MHHARSGSTVRHLLRTAAVLLVVLVGRPALAQPFAISTYEADGTFVGRFQATLPEMHIDDVEIGPDGNLWIARADNAHSRNVPNPNDMLAVFDADGVELRTVQGGGMRHPTAPTGPQYFHRDVALGTDRIWVRTPRNGSGDDLVRAFDLAGGQTAAFSTEPISNRLVGLRLGANGNLFTCDLNDGALLEITTGGALVGSTPLPGLTPWVTDFAFTASGQVIVAHQLPPCVGDLDDSRVVDFADILPILAEWGPCGKDGSCREDLDGSGTVDFGDVLVVLANWGPCP